MKKYILLLSSLCICVGFLGISSIPDNNFHIIACDVGQGDAILVMHGNSQILIDGGPDNKVLNCLSRHVPFWDRTLELVVLTHPQSDHYMGLVEVLKRYRVPNFLGNAVDNSAGSYGLLKKEIGSLGIKVINPKIDMTVRVNSIDIKVVNPPELQEYQNSNQLGIFQTKEDLNNFSIVLRLTYGNFSALTTGDMGPAITERVIATGLAENVTYLKVPHHGSKNGLTQKLLDVANPRIAVISVGAKNRYGHPNQEVIDMLTNTGVIIRRTDFDHDVEVVSDGRSWWLKK